MWLTEGRGAASFLALLLALAMVLSGCASGDAPEGASAGSSAGDLSPAISESADEHAEASASLGSFDLSAVPSYADEPSVAINQDVPFFDAADKARTSFEEYASLDDLGRCGVAFALVGEETMPVEERGSIGAVRPSGWQIAKYDWVDGKYLFNRCHLIGYQLAGENANECNLITGTRYLNVEGMLPLEDQVASYVRETGNHVLYRATPMFAGNNLVASGVLLEALSVEDDGAGVSFCRWCYNVQPGVVIDYATGDNHAQESGEVIDVPRTSGEFASSAASAAEAESDTSDASASSAALPASDASDVSDISDSSGASDSNVRSYILNANTKRFHLPGCSAVSRMKETNKIDFEGTREQVIAQGYTPCGLCNP